MGNKALNIILAVAAAVLAALCFASIAIANK
jgi:hypothetical protein